MALSAARLGLANIPCGRPIVGLCSVVHPFTVTAHEKHLVCDIAARPVVQLRDLAIESLPLGRLLLRVTLRVGIIGSVDEAEVDRGLVSLANIPNTPGRIL